ncbi:MAG: hypothetical protein AAGF60_05255 [Pseudomonadota bacterium]
MTKYLKSLTSPRNAPAGPLALAAAVQDLTDRELADRNIKRTDIAREIMINGLWK